MPVNFNTRRDSGTAVRSVAKKVQNDAIYLTVVTTVIHGKLTPTFDKPVKLGRIAPGDYKVYYRYPGANDVLLTSVIVPSK